MRVESHLHQCQSCGVQTPCSGSLEENYDGFPSVICLDFHIFGGEINPDFICDDCGCVDCGERWATTARDYTGPDSFVIVKVCESCGERRDNREPDDPDGEAFRGGELAAFQAEQMDAMRRLK